MVGWRAAGATGLDLMPSWPRSLMRAGQSALADHLKFIRKWPLAFTRQAQEAINSGLIAGLARE